MSSFCSFSLQGVGGGERVTETRVQTVSILDHVLQITKTHQIKKGKKIILEKQQENGKVMFSTGESPSEMSLPG